MRPRRASPSPPPGRWRFLSSHTPPSRLALALAVGTALGLAAAPPAWRLEEASTSTWENALFSLRMLAPAPAVQRVIVVTSPFHLGRAARTFEAAAAAVGREGGRASSSSTPFAIFAAAPPVARPASPAERATATYEAAREVAALAWYWVRGRLK